MMSLISFLAFVALCGVFKMIDIVIFGDSFEDMKKETKRTESKN